ncbi:PAS domain S-box protein [Methanoregula sp.]|uniref:PAS domain S-box protein n=1 Tax=Methanoregula sp. TaxID=2052170 RepID=UPI003563923B
MEEKFVILCCENIRPEVDTILATGAMPLACARSFPFHCGHVKSVWSTVKDQVGELETAGATTCLCGCGCANSFDVPEDILKRPSLVLVESGATLFLPETLVNDFRLRGTYLILPGWLFRWRKNAEQDQLDRTTTREMFRESLTEIVLLDTGVHTGTGPALAEFSDFTGLPARVLPVGLEHFRFHLGAEYRKWQCSQEITACKATVMNAERRVADYSMVADLTGKLIGIHDEKAVISRMLELISLLCSPKRTGFLLIRENGENEIISLPAKAYSSTVHFQRIFEPAHQYYITEAGDGFLFRVLYNNNLIGILSVDQVALPASVDEYLNITHFITEIAGLSITIARIHQNLVETIAERDTEIAERKKIQTELSLHSEILQNLAEGVALVRASNGTIAFANTRFSQLFGYTAGELLGRSVADLNAPDTRSPTEIADEIVTELERAGIWMGEIRNLKKDGTVFWCHAMVSAFYHPVFGKVWITVHEDITDRKKIETALSESEEQYRNILENIVDVFFRIDEENKIVMVSPSAAPTFGYTSTEEMQGRPILSLWKSPDMRVTFLDAMRIGGGSVQDWEGEFVKKDGTVFWVSISAHLNTDPEGRYAGTEGIIRDISERKQIEEALKGAVKKLNMLSSITRHDILNQLMGLRTYLDLSREDLKGTRFAEFIEKEDQAAEAIQRQIEFTKYYQDIGVDAPKWQDTETVIRNALAQLNPPAVDVRIMVAGYEIFADPLIEKVFYNLMENSLRHGERVSKMAFSSSESEAGLVLIYSDDGVGITEEDKKRLFRKGFGKHTGLGLFLSREILAITGIAITENGVPGEGVRFEMCVPKEGYRQATPK